MHASAVALNGRALLILGPSGSGKSSLALAMIARGAALVSDDIVLARRDSRGRAMLAAPPGARPRIEARGVGILDAPAASGPVPAAAVAMMHPLESDRLPPVRMHDLLGVPLRIFHNTGKCSFSDAMNLYLRHPERPN